MTARKLTKREKTIFAICLTMIVIYGGYRFIFQYFQTQQDTLGSRIQLAERKLQKKLDILRLEKEINQKHAGYLKLLEQKSSDQKEMAAILSEMEAVGNALDIKIEDMKPQRIKKESFYNYFSVSVQAKGEMPAIAQFLYNLETPPHSFKIDELRLEKRSLRTADVECQIVASRLLIQP